MSQILLVDFEKKELFPEQFLHLSFREQQVKELFRDNFFHSSTNFTSQDG